MRYRRFISSINALTSSIGFYECLESTLTRFLDDGVETISEKCVAVGGRSRRRQGRSPLPLPPASRSLFEMRRVRAQLNMVPIVITSPLLKHEKLYIYIYMIEERTVAMHKLPTDQISGCFALAD